MKKIERIYWIDWVKSIGIWLVILGHLPFIGNKLIFNFHMPLFFVLSGYLYKPIPIFAELKKSSKKLLFPYFMYSMFLLLSSIKSNTWGGYVYNIILGNQELLPLNYRALWFLVSLFIIRLFFSLTYFFNPLYIMFISIILFVITSFMDNIPNTSDIFQFQTSLMCLPFFGLGYLLNQYKVLESIRIKRKVPTILLVFVLACAIGLLNSKNGAVNVFRCCYGSYLVLFYISSFVISISILMISSCCLNIKNKIIEEISKGTLLIVGFHQSVIDIINQYIKINSNSAIIASLIILYMFWVVIRFFGNRYPIIIGRI